MKQFTAIIWREQKWFVAQCPQLDIVSQGTTLEEAKLNLQEAMDLWFDTASQEEINARMPISSPYVTQVEVAHG